MPSLSHQSSPLPLFSTVKPGHTGSARLAEPASPWPTSPTERTRILNDPSFGRYFTDHMVSVSWSTSRGWYDAEVLPFGMLTLHPAASVLHYGQEIFEGMKAYRHPDNSVVTFRPNRNAARFAASARRLAMPEVPEELFIRAVDELVRADADWVPSGGEHSLYLRPYLIADEGFLGVRPSDHARFLVIASPAGPYFSGGVTPVSIWLSRDLARAGRGGTGAAKCGGNYASSLRPQQIAREHGCDQVLFTDAATEDTIDEAGSMNVFLVTSDGTLVTPALTGTILDGITRRSIITLARDRGLTVEERQVTVSEWRLGAADGRIVEAFATGTAAVVTPISRLVAEDFTIDMGPEPGAVTLSLREELTGIQTGGLPDRHHWLHTILPG